MIPGMSAGGDMAVTGGDAGPATSGNSGNTNAGFSGGFTVGDYFGKGSQVKKSAGLNNWVLIGGGLLVAFWLFKKKK